MVTGEYCCSEHLSFLGAMANWRYSTWDWAVNWGCYVPGAYTDANCSKGKLIICDCIC